MLLELPGSTLSQHNDYPHIPDVPSPLPGKWCDGILNETVTASFRILSNLLFTSHPFFRRCTLWNTNKVNEWTIDKYFGCCVKCSSTSQSAMHPWCYRQASKEEYKFRDIQNRSCRSDIRAEIKMFSLILTVVCNCRSNHIYKYMVLCCDWTRAVLLVCSITSAEICGQKFAIILSTFCKGIC
jgi:hypothetical protein